MILLDWNGTHSTAPGIVLLFGSGLIGGAIASTLKQAAPGAASLRLNWSWPQPSNTEAQAVEDAARAAMAVREGADLTVIWAAGRSGFGSDPVDMAKEFTALERVIQTTLCVGAALAPQRRAFIHISSAGGLFEGRVACGAGAVPAPLRSYGHGKLAQEQRVRRDESLGRRLILRPSSVYGYTRGARRGLVPALVAAAMQQSEATIFGSLTTLRDYIYAPDIGRFVAARLLLPAQHKPAVSTEICLLASARPASVFEIIRLVERYLGGALRLRVNPHPENACDNTFLPSALPEGFRPTGLQEGVAMTVGAVTRERFLGVTL